MKNESYKALDIIYSVKDMILLLGLDNEYTNIYDSDLELKNEKSNDIRKNELIEKELIRNRNKNIKFIINLIKKLFILLNITYIKFWII